MAPLMGYRRWFEAATLMRANSWMLMTGSLGMVASTLPVQWLVPLLGWCILFLALGGFVLLAMVVMVWQVPAWHVSVRQGQDAARPVARYADVWKHPYLR